MSLVPVNAPEHSKDADLLSLVSATLAAEIKKHGLWDYRFSFSRSVFEPSLERTLDRRRVVIQLDVELGHTRCEKRIRLTLRQRVWQFSPILPPISGAHTTPETVSETPGVHIPQASDTQEGAVSHAAPSSCLCDPEVNYFCQAHNKPDYVDRFRGATVHTVAITQQPDYWEVLVMYSKPGAVRMPFPYLVDTHDEAEALRAAIWGYYK